MNQFSRSPVDRMPPVVLIYPIQCHKITVKASFFKEKCQIIRVQMNIFIEI